MEKTKTMMKMENLLGYITRNPEFQKLKSIGGHKIYHQEGNAYIHSLMVVEQATKEWRDWKDAKLMILVALLHDIGKIWSSVQNSEDPNDWSYPNHAPEGAKDERLSLFISKDDPNYEVIKGYIKFHIEPLFWKNMDDVEKTRKQLPKGCTIKNLAKLALCDLNGSIGVDPQEEKKAFLRDIIEKEVD